MTMQIVRKYYRLQQAKGHSLAKATLLIPLEILNQISLKTRIHPKGNVITGFSEFRLPLLASYSRSGTNWIRYFVETCSNRPTPGETRRISGNNYVIDRAHRAYSVMHNYRKVVLLVRDYRECLLRHNKDHWLSTMDVTRFLENPNFNQPCLWYIKNIEAFDEFKGDKLLIYYEDIIKSAEREFVRLGKFLDLPQEEVVDFVNHIEENFNASVSAYTAGGHSTETAKTRSITAHANTLLTDTQRKEFDAYFKTKYPNLAQKYLKRYFEA